MDRPTLLVVDDHEDFLVSAKMVFEYELPNVEVVTEPDPEDALWVLHRQHVDVVLADYRMPSMDGLTFLVRAHDFAPDARRILITAFPDLGVILRGINEVGIDYYIRKPTGGEQLLDIVRDAIGRRDHTSCPNHDDAYTAGPGLTPRRPTRSDRDRH